MTAWVGVLRLQAIFTGIVCASAVALAAPGSPGKGADANEAERSVARGADLSHGIAFVLAPEWGVVYRNALRRIRDDIGAALSADGIRHDNLRITGGVIRFHVAPSALARARASIARAAEAAKLTAAASMPGLAVRAGPGGDITVQLTGFGLAGLQDGFIASARRELARRLSGGGFDDCLVTGDGGRIRVEIPPMAAPARAGRLC
jgi:preprotein translocase subunit SecD